MTNAIDSNINKNKKKPDYNILERHFTLAEKKLFGNIRVVTRSMYHITNEAGKEMKILLSEQKEHYNIAGYLIAEEIYSSTYDMTDKVLFKYDDKGKPVEMDISGTISQRQLTFYDAKGQEIENEILDTAGKVLSKTEIKYDAYGYIVTMKDIVSDSVTDNVGFSYPDNGNTKEAHHYNKEGSAYMTYVSKYNEQGLTMVSYSIDHLQTVNNKDTFIYDGKGNLIERDELKSDGTINKKLVCEYDGKGHRTIQSNYLHEGDKFKIISKTLFEYDTLGNMISCTEKISLSGDLTTARVTEITIENY